MIPEEGPGPSWLRDYGLTDFGDIAADLNAMAEYAAKLSADVNANYMPHTAKVSTAFDTALPVAHPGFQELVVFLETHDAVRDVTKSNVAAFGQGSTMFADAATKISGEYRTSDSFSRATVGDVNNALTDAAQPSAEGDI